LYTAEYDGNNVLTGARNLSIVVAASDDNTALLAGSKKAHYPKAKVQGQFEAQSDDSRTRREGQER
jgi:hypothetical protein